jgi:hypothetical protein
MMVQGNPWQLFSFFSCVYLPRPDNGSAAAMRTLRGMLFWLAMEAIK